MPETGPKVLWLPETARPPSVFVCRICGEEIPLLSMSDQTKHVQRCSEQYREALEELSPVRRLAEWNAVPDPEWEAYNNALKADGLNPEVQYNRGRRSNIRRASEH